MDSVCGKVVQFLRTDSWITCARVSTQAADETGQHMPASVQPSVFHGLFHSLPQALSTYNLAVPPLIEHIFYPVSTPTYYNNHQGKI
jgi:hypothetical protein